MKEILKAIYDSKLLNLVIGLTIFSLAGIYFYFDRPDVSSTKDLKEIKGTLSDVNQVLVYTRKIKKTESDSTYHIFLEEYPCKFQVSYASFDGKGFYDRASKGDKITLHIANQDLEKLTVKDARIRSFSLKLNNKVYLAVENGLSEFGDGYLILGLILIPLAINILLIKTIIK
jgi:hypothetical protein